MTKFHKGDIVTVENPYFGGFGMIFVFDCYDSSAGDCWVIHRDKGRLPANSGGFVLYDTTKHDKLFADPKNANAIKQMAPVKHFPDIDNVEVTVSVALDAPKISTLPCPEYDFGSGDIVQVKEEAPREYDAVKKMIGTVTTGGKVIARVNFSDKGVDVPISILRMIDKRSDGLHNYEQVRGFRHDIFVCKKCGKKRNFDHKKDVA